MAFLLALVMVIGLLPGPSSFARAEEAAPAEPEQAAAETAAPAQEQPLVEPEVPAKIAEEPQAVEPRQPVSISIPAPANASETPSEALKLPHGTLVEQTLTDDTGRVKVTGLLPQGATVTARPLSCEEFAALAASDQRVAFAYDITIWMDGEEYQPTEQVLVQVAEEGLPGSGLTVSHVETNERGMATARPVESQVIDGDAYFAADSFSIYIAVVSIEDQIQLESGAGYKFYSDADCTTELSGVVEWTAARTIYVKSTNESVTITSVTVRNAEDGSVSTYATVTELAGGVFAVSFDAPGDGASNQIIDVARTGVPVIIDLGFVPTAYTNDSSMPTLLIPGTVNQYMQSQTVGIEAEAGETITLGAPTRFGYTFDGWTKTVGSNSTTLESNEDTPSASNLAAGITYAATWKPNKYPFVLQSSTSQVPAANALISFTGIPTQTIEAFAQANSGVFSRYDQSTLYFMEYFTYGETLGEYFARVASGWTVPTMLDTRSNEARLTFAGWLINSNSVSADSQLCLGSGGVLNSSAAQNLSAYHGSLHTDQTAMLANWATGEFTLSVSNAPSGWSWSYTLLDQNGHPVVTPLSGSSFSIPVGATVNMTVSASATSYITGWNITYNASGISRKLLPAEQPYAAGDPNISYSFTMPAQDVTASYSFSAYVNIALSPIVFQENVSYNNRTFAGFWYAGAIEGLSPLFTDDRYDLRTGSGNIGSTGSSVTSNLTSFYPWDFSKSLYVTSNNVSTTNQLILCRDITVYLNDTVLAGQANYLQYVSGRTINGQNTYYHLDQSANRLNISELNAAADLSTYANIVFNNREHEQFTVNLYMVGNNNRIMSIMPDTLRYQGIYANTVKIYGSGNVRRSLCLGTIFGSFTLSRVQALDITAQGSYKYLFNFAYGGDLLVSNCSINAKNKDVLIGNSNIQFTNSRVIINNSISYLGPYIEGTSYVHCYGSCYAGYSGMSVKHSASLIVEKDVVMSYHHADGNAATMANIGTSGCVIVKGVLDIGSGSINKGTVIANSLVFAQCGGISGGTILVNQIMNAPFSSTSYSLSAEDIILSHASSTYVRTNGDNYPYQTYTLSSSAHTNYTFSGGTIYLLGYYGAFEGENAVSANNPVKPFLEGMLDPDTGELDSTKTFDSAAALAAVRSSTCTSNECIILGDSTFKTATRSRTVYFSGSTVYAAGNMTLFNDTYVSAGTIECQGTFGSKGDVTVSGGSLMADQVGNAYDLKKTDGDGTSRWMTTTVSGGAITAERIGAFSTCVSNNSITPRSTVVITDGTAILGTPLIVHDEYINYVYDTALFSNPTGNPNTMRFEGLWNTDASTLADMVWTVAQPVAFLPPTLLGEDDVGDWCYDSLTNPAVTGIAGADDPNGVQIGTPVNALGAVGGVDNAYSISTEPNEIRDRLTLYARKANYTVILKEDPDSKVSAITFSGDASGVSSFVNGKKSVPGTALVSLTLNDSTYAAEYTILWYVDGSGLYHSVMPTVTGSVITFEMPYADVELYVTRDLSLDLNAFEVGLFGTGFETEYVHTRPDSFFHYMGNLTLSQHGYKTRRSVTQNPPVLFTSTAAKKTKHRIRVDGSFDNTADGARTVTLQNIIQQDIDNQSIGLLIDDGAKALLLLNGNILICRTQINETAELIIRGVNGPDVDGYYAEKGTASGGISIQFGNSTGPMGNTTLQNIRILTQSNERLYGFGRSSSKGNTVFRLVDCVVVANKFYSSNSLCTNAKKCVLDNCSISAKQASDWMGNFFSNVDELEIVNGTTLSFLNGGATASTSVNIFSGAKSVLIQDSSVTSSYLDHNSSTAYNYAQYPKNMPAVITLEGNSTYTTDRRIRLRKLVVNSGVVNVGSAGDGWLLADSIEMNGGSLNAGGVLVGGFYDVSSYAYNAEPVLESGFIADVSAGKNIFNGADYDGLVLNGGTISASEFVGGDVNAKVTVNGGTLNAPAIGTSGYIWGYTRRVPRNTEPFIYKYARIPTGATVSVTGGTVNVTAGGYLGGMNATVNVTGGTVNLADGAIVGMTEADATKLVNHYSANNDSIYAHTAANCSVNLSGGLVQASANTGSVSAPYGTVRVSGENANVDVYDLKADGGTIEISGADGEIYANPYTGSDRRHEAVAIMVANDLTASSIAITDGAVVYANEAVANVPAGQSGGLVVQKTAAGDTRRAFLYTGGSYGATGAGTITNDYETGSNDSENVNIFGSQVVNVTYVMDRNGVMLPQDLSYIEFPGGGENITHYNVITDIGAAHDVRYVPLLEPSCVGYTFTGWVNAQGRRATEIDKLNRADQTFYATWERVVVPFRIYITVSNANEVEPSVMTQVGSSNVYFFNALAYGQYGSVILGTGANRVNLDAYTTKSDVVTEVTLTDSDFVAINKGNQLLITSGIIVNKDMVQAYQGKAEPEPLKLEATNTVMRNARFAFHMNLNAQGKPAKAVFNNVVWSTPALQTATEIAAYIPLNERLGFVSASVTNGTTGQLMQPTAPGYTFGGWYTNAECTGTPVTGIETVSSLLGSGNTEFYAKWTPNDYTVRFKVADDVSENTWITPADDGTDATRPGEYDATNNPGNAALDYRWTYDTAIAASSFKTTYSYKNVLGQTVSGTNIAYTVLPAAWREGYKFVGWEYTVDETRYTLEPGDELNIASFAELDTDAGTGAVAMVFTAVFKKATVTYHVTKGAWTTGDAAVIGTPLSGGDGKTYVNDSLAYLYPLAAYVAKPGPGSSDSYDVVAQNTNGAAVDHDYGVISTTAAYYKDHDGAYVSEDFRETISRKGYTFAGWTLLENSTGGNYYSAPRFEDIEVYDQWTANTYGLLVYGKATTGIVNNYTSAFSSNAESSYGFGDTRGAEYPLSVTVGQPISGLPARDGDSAWYAINKVGLPENYRRYLIGVTFAPLDPGTSVEGDIPQNDAYMNYAEAISHMFASGTLLQEGTGYFYLPEDAAYLRDIGSATVVTGSSAAISIADYPTGSLIKTYGVYRERSLVLVERYLTGEEHRRIVYSGPWSTWHGVSYSSLEIERQGFKFVGWYVNSENVRPGWEYPTTESVYNSMRDTYRQDAQDRQIYDIVVYTVYVPVANQTVTLTADSDPTNAQPSDTYIYTLPSSIQTGHMSFTVTLPAGVQLTSVNDMKAHLLDDTWITEGNRYSSNDTVAIRMTIHANGDAGNNIDPCTQTYDLAYYHDGNAHWFESVGEQALRFGDTITLELFHSDVMRAEELVALWNDDAETIRFRFDNDGVHTNENTLGQQQINLKINVQMVDSLYNAHYIVTLPESLDTLTVIDDQGFDMPVTGTVATKEEKVVAYGTIKDQPTPELEGYTASIVRLSNDYPAIEDGNSCWNVIAAPAFGEITVAAAYEPVTYLLQADEGTLRDWRIEYTDGTSNQHPLSSPLDAPEGEQVKYHSSITFAPHGDVYPEFVTLTMKQKDSDAVHETHLLSEYMVAGENSAALQMPAYDIYVTYDKSRTLYLDDGSILLTENGYKQKEGSSDTHTWSEIKEIIWHGDYVILQNADNNTATEDTVNNPGWVNTLTIEGDQTKRSVTDPTTRSITLGNLKFTSEDSITLSSTGIVGAEISVGNDSLSGSIEAKSIRVPSNAALTLQSGRSTNASVTLIPSSGAAIGGSASDPGSGSITLSHIALSMDLNASDTDMVPGIGTGAYASTGAVVTVVDCVVTVAETGAGSWDGGAWIGGHGVSAVAVSNTTISRSTTQSEAVFGLKVIDGETVAITNSAIGAPTAAVYDPVHAGSSLTVQDSSIYLENKYGINDHAMIGTDDGATHISGSTVQIPYSGGSSNVLYTGAMVLLDAATDLTINGVQIVDIYNGHMTIGADQIRQGSEDHVHAGVDTYYFLAENSKGSASNVQVTTPVTITVKAPQVNGVTVEDTFTPNTPTMADIAIGAETELLLEGDLTVTGAATLANAPALTVAGEAHTLTFSTSSSDVFSGGGTFEMENGSLIVEGRSFGAATGNNPDVALTDVTATVTSLYARELTVDGGSIAASGSVGSTGSSGAVTHVTFRDTEISAASIGALGPQDTAFIFVDYRDESNTITGDVIADWYRLTYDTPASMVASALPGVLRTVETYDAGRAVSAEITQPAAGYSANGVPAAPTVNGIPDFEYWYIMNENGERTQLTSNASPSTSMMTGGTTILTSATTSSEMFNSNPDDGTKTLKIRAWSYTGEVKLATGRRIRDFSGGTTVTVQKNSAWTARLTVSGALTSGHDYRVTFKNSSGVATALPVGTDLTLTKISGSAGSETYTYYYYTVTSSNVSSVLFSAFSRLDTGAAFVSAEDAVSDELFLLSADFSESAAIAVSQYQVSFELLLSDDRTGIALGSAVSYTLTDFTEGSIALSGTGNTVLTISSPSGIDSLKDRKVYLAGVITKDSDIFVRNAGVEVSFNGVPGTWIAGDTVVFELGTYGHELTSPVTVSFAGLLNGTYSVSWRLCAASDNGTNFLRNDVSGAASATSKAIQWSELPSFMVEGPVERVYTRGEAHTLRFTLMQNNVAGITATAQKQGAFGLFTSVGANSIGISSPDPTTVTLPADLGAGVYRLVFSIDADSEDDNVYYSFIVE